MPHDKSREIAIAPLSAEAFAPFGDVIEVGSVAPRHINQGMCERFHDLARLDFGQGGRAGISLFQAKPRMLPMQLDMVERHPEGSQAFLPLSLDRFLVIVAEDEGGRPSKPSAFLTAPGQGVNYLRGTWHGVLTPLSEPGLFAVIDRIGDTANLDEHWFDEPYRVLPPDA